MKTSKILKFIAIIIIIAVLSFIIIQLTGNNKTTDQLDITVRLLWLNQAQFAGIYSAVEEGFYRAEGLNVSIIPGGPGINPVRMIASGSEELGICSASDIIIAREKNIPVKALAVIVIDNPTSFFAKKSAGINNVKDFIGKKVGVKIGFELEYYLTAMLKFSNVKEEQIERVPIQFDMTPFFNDEVDVWCGYRINEPNIAREKGFDIVEILPKEYGVNIAGDVIFTSEEFYQRNPEACRKFVNSTYRGWIFARENIVKAVEYTMKYNEKGDRKHETAMLKSIIPLIFEGDRTSFSDQDANFWKKMIDFLYNNKVIEFKINSADCFWKLQ